MTTSTMEKLEYVNDFVYFVIAPDEAKGNEVQRMCFGVNMNRFRPVTSGKYGISCNPILSGFKLLKYDIFAFAMSLGAIPNSSADKSCRHIPPTGDPWHVETLRIENAAHVPPEDILRFGVGKFIRKVIVSSRLDYPEPVSFLSPAELQTYFEALCGAMA